MDPSADWSASALGFILAACESTVSRRCRSPSRCARRLVCIHAQDADRAAILATVQKVFDAMRTRDTALLTRRSTAPRGWSGVSTPWPSPAVSLTAPSQFGAAIAKAPAGDVWNERIFDPEVKIDGTVAQVWAYYTFHRNATFSHCGVDAFMLVKVGTAWKITQLADSRRTRAARTPSRPASSRSLGVNAVPRASVLTHGRRWRPKSCIVPRLQH